MKITVKVDMSGFNAWSRRVQEQSRFATALALTRTAQAVKQDLRAEMASLFEAPRAYTLNSLYIKPATKTDLQASVGIKGGAIAWLRPEIYGGPRQKALEKYLQPLGLPPAGMWAVPGSGAKITSGKHISLAWVRKLVTALSSQGAATKKRKRAGSLEYLVVLQREGKLAPGIYGRKGGTITPLIMFVKQPHYRAKFNFYKVAEASARKRFPPAFREALSAALAKTR